MDQSKLVVGKQTSCFIASPKAVILEGRKCLWPTVSGKQNSCFYFIEGSYL